MADILDKILADKRIEVEQRKTDVPLEQLREQIASLPKCRNFYRAVTKPNPRFIRPITAKRI